MSTSLGQKTFVGLLWAGFGQIGSQSIHYLVLLVLAWLLSPADFGLAGLAMVFITFTQAMGELGLAAALVQRKSLSDADINTAFWANLFVGVLLGAFSFLGAEQIARLLGEPEVIPLLKALCVIFPITALGVVPRALLERQLDFNQLSKREFASEVGFGIVGLGLAVSGAGVWSLVGAAIAQRLLGTIILWWAMPRRPAFEFNIQSLKELLQFGFYVMTATGFAKGVANADYFVVGRWLGVEALGYYTLAFQLAVIPTRRLIGVLHKVAFPSFSIVKSDVNRLRRGFIEAVQYLFLLLAPISFFLIVLSPLIVETIYGSKWLESVRPLQILAIAGLFYGFDVAEALYFAVGKPKIRIWIVGLRLILFISMSALFGIQLGVNGIALSLVLSVICTSFLSFLVASNITGITFRDLLRPCWATTMCALGASILGLLLGELLEPMVVSWINILVTTCLMTLAYLGTVSVIYPATFVRIRTYILQAISPL